MGHLRDALDMEHLLSDLGIAYTRRGRTLYALCPNPDHEDHKPSWSIVDDPGTRKHGGHGCFACGFGGGPWELAQVVRGFDREQAAQYCRALALGKPRQFDGLPRVVVADRSRARGYELPSGVCIPSLDGSVMPRVFADYLAGRGVTEQQVERWQIGYARRGRLAWRVVIPVHTRGRLVAHVARAVFDDRIRYDMPLAGSGAQPSLALLGEPFLSREKTPVLTIAEGSFSALALERAGAPNPVALLGSDWSAERAAILSATKWERVIVATDPDAAGDKAASLIANSFRRSEIVRLRLGDSPDDCSSSVLSEAVAAALS